jgi:hypothetical protein
MRQSRIPQITEGNESGRIMVFIKANRKQQLLADFNAANGGVLNGTIQSL